MLPGSTGGRLAAVMLVLCLGPASPAPADPPGKSVIAKQTAVASVRKLRPPRGLATYKAMIARHAAAHGVPVKLATAVVWQESRYKPQAVGSSGERGLMQIMPATARGLGYRGGADGLLDPDTNLEFGMKYLAKAYDMAAGDICETVLRYNGGLGARTMTDRARTYCAKVKRHMKIPMRMP